MPGALDDLRVIDATGPIGHYAGRLLADLGADVIKVEPLAGDPARLWPPFLPDTPEPESGLLFLLLNANKRGVRLDLADEQGREAFLRLVATADVLIESWSSQEADSLHLIDEALHEVRPDLIRCSVTGWGLDGPSAGLAYADIVTCAMSGVMQLAGFPDGTPEQLPALQSHACASINAAAGILAAVLHRDATGEGQRVEVSAQEALLMAQETAMQGADINGVDRARTGGTGVLPVKMPGLGVYEVDDGFVYAMCTGTAGSGFAGLVRLMTDLGFEHGLDREPYATFIRTSMTTAQVTALLQDPAQSDRVRPLLEEIEAVVSAFFRRYPKETLYVQGQERRALIGAVNGPREISESVQLVAREWFRSIDDAGRGQTLRYPGPPWRLHGTPATLRRPAPLLGEHNMEVFRESGLAPDAIAALTSDGTPAR
ncbi:MAG: CoA transferase [Chloroflexi bacterium]|nr:CoA transferase [Chloroflexota bacterium]